MEKWRVIALLGCIMLLLVGCDRGTEDPYRVDTVVQIPVNPTDTPTEAPETAAPTEISESQEETESSKAAASSSKKNSSGSKSSSGSKNHSSTDNKTTEPTATEPPVTEPAVREPDGTEPAYDPASYQPGSLEYAILDVLNECRAEAGLSKLTMNRKLCGIAALRAEEAQQIWSHTRPDGRNFTSALADYGYGYSIAAENLAHTMDAAAQAIVAKWMNTDSRNNILNESFTTAGIGIYSTGGMSFVCNILVG